jgi:uncharacterized protein with NRDE domain
VCLIAIAWQSHPRYALVLAGNRDEFLARPTEALHWWSDDRGGEPSILAGRDLQAGGSWLGIARSGRLAAVTNFREPAVARDPHALSRGALVTDVLLAPQPVGRCLSELAASHARYSGFNLLAASGLGSSKPELWFDSNRGGAPARALVPGVYGLSNGQLDEDWPKVRRARSSLRALLTEPRADDAAELTELLLALLSDATPAPEASLPHTGVSLDVERQLSPLFIRMTGYGTRASSVVTVTHEGALRFTERSLDRSGVAQTRSYEATIGPLA